MEIYKLEDKMEPARKLEKPAVVTKLPPPAVPSISKQERMKLIREHTQSKFE